ncbi:MAG: hypothetical protein LBI96_07930 [Odoribacteraceae bacterium]|nr:hypothetical protein [Odoribacteraceae bacterium]
MDDFSSEKKGVDGLTRALKACVVVLSAALVAVLVLFFVARRENRANTRVMEGERELLRQELVDLSGNYDGLRSSNDSLNARLALEREKIAGLMERMTKFRANSFAEIDRYKREVGTLKSVMRSYVVQIDSLNRSNVLLRAENSEVKRQMGWVRERNKSLEEKTSRMEETLELASALAAEHLELVPVNTRERETRVGKCAQLRAGFVLGRNVTARRGQRVIFLRVTRPDGGLVADAGGGTFRFQDVELGFSARREVVYEGEALEVSIYWPNDGSLERGLYRADLFCDGTRIGSGEFLLK